ncbi:MAG: aminoacetone oxidase family FAD-binding enzyme, partial [Phenylobacterium sp.]|nr:aminoacetone oxidase family FAD-binding enzyme [Phenylobacterium sp.]
MTAVAVIGAGPAGLMAAEVLAEAGCAVTVYDRMPSVGRKLLMAGRGGLNLTHSEPLDRFVARFGTASPRLGPLVEAFPPQALVAWAEGLGQPTFVGSSGRVFPKSLKASPLLRAWLARLQGLGVAFRPRHDWTGWEAGGRLRFATPAGEATASPDAVVLALGGASWPKLGSNGAWADILASAGVPVSPLRPANGGFDVAWGDLFRDRFEGQPLKGVALTFGRVRVRGEAMVTRHGLEGGA